MSTQTILDRPVQAKDNPRRIDPAQLSHYVSIAEMDQFILGEVESVEGICGYTWNRHISAPNVNVFAEARKPGRVVCWKCQHIHSFMKKSSNGGGAA